MLNISPASLYCRSLVVGLHSQQTVKCGNRIVKPRRRKARGHHNRFNDYRYVNVGSGSNRVPRTSRLLSPSARKGPQFPRQCVPEEDRAMVFHDGGKSIWFYVSRSSRLTILSSFKISSFRLRMVAIGSTCGRRNMPRSTKLFFWSSFSSYWSGSPFYTSSTFSARVIPGFCLCSRSGWELLAGVKCFGGHPALDNMSPGREARSLPRWWEGHSGFGSGCLMLCKELASA